MVAGFFCGVGAREASAQAALGVYDVGDFTGDGWADYADRYVANGDIYIHTNNHNGTWQPSGTQWGQGTTLAGPWIETLVGDIDGDGRADLIQRDRSSGMLWKVFNKGPGVGTFNALAATASPWLTQTTNWKLLVADFTGDGLVDLAEQYVPNGDIYIHANTHTSNWYASGAYAGQMLMPPAGVTWDIIVGHFNGSANAGYAIVKKSGTYFGYPNGWFEVHAYSPVTGFFAPVSSGFGYYSSTPGFSVFGQKVAF